MLQDFNIIDLSKIDQNLRPYYMRVNGLGSLYYFTKVILKRNRLNSSYHVDFCKRVSEGFVKAVIESPRMHFKSTICTEALPMWWALPFSNRDEDTFRALGYNDEFITYLKYMHNPDTRTLIASETITNASMLGRKIRRHFESNDLFRGLYSEILPSEKDTWTSSSLHVKRTSKDTGHGEGTFDFIGVGGALQSRHYPRVIEDDLVGKKALDSPSGMEETKEFHQLLVGAFDNEDKTHDSPELVVGNRWDFDDLNSYIRKREPWFTIESHSALGGCCTKHLYGECIFPEEFNSARLEREKIRLGSYLFSCQFLNSPSAPEDADFKQEWLRYYHIEEKFKYNRVNEKYKVLVLEPKFEYEEKQEIELGHLDICMTTDPAHGGNIAAGRCRNAITVVGRYGDYFFLLDVFARQCGDMQYIAKLFEMAQTWGVTKVGVETSAGQLYLASAMRIYAQSRGFNLRIEGLRGEVERADGLGVSHRKDERIRGALRPLFEAGRFYTLRNEEEFFSEYKQFPRRGLKDILDALAYAPQLLKGSGSAEQVYQAMLLNHRRSTAMKQKYSMSR